MIIGEHRTANWTNTKSHNKKKSKRRNKIQCNLGRKKVNLKKINLKSDSERSKWRSWSKRDKRVLANKEGHD